MVYLYARLHKQLLNVNTNSFENAYKNWKL